MIDGRRERREVAGAAERTGITSRALSRNIRTLSGGNQQKSLLARWLMHGCELLVCIEPTRGVDVGAKIEIYRQLEGLARNGAGVLVVSTDLPEILGLSDRVVVLWTGHDPGRARSPHGDRAGPAAGHAGRRRGRTTRPARGGRLMAGDVLDARRTGADSARAACDRSPRASAPCSWR